MSRRALSESLETRASKRARLDHLTKEDFKNGIFLAPMVRSGALPTRLYALKHGATLVWGPEIVDKAILHAERVVDPETGVISYNGKSRAMFATHPIEKPYLIYQIGSSDPELAVQAAKIVQQDVSGIDLNCGCPKPFSTHAGMGAALLTNPDLLCSILVALRKAMPPEITVSAKIRLLPSREDTLKLVERICNTGISALTVHCRTRNMRDKDAALIGRLQEIVEFVEKMGKGIAVIENGDCEGYEDAKRVRETTGAHSVMIARAAESNPSCFSPEPLTDVESTFTPAYLRLAYYLKSNWSLTKFCANQFTGNRVKLSKNDAIQFKKTISRSKDFEDIEPVVGPWNGEEEFNAIVAAVESRPPRIKEVSSNEAEASPLALTGELAPVPAEPSAASTPFIITTTTTPESRTQPHIGDPAHQPTLTLTSTTTYESASPSASEYSTESASTPIIVSTPLGTENPEPPSLDAPRMPVNLHLRPVPAIVSGDLLTPTPTPTLGRGLGFLPH